MEPLVSVVIPTHNRKSLVVRAVNSVLAQSYQNLECIVVDDASNDGTMEELRKIDDPRLKLLRNEESRHASATRNVGIANSSGEYVAFLDDDDEWMPSKLRRQMDLFNTCPAQVGLIYCWLDYYDGEGRLSKHHHPKLQGAIFGDVFDEQRIGNCSTLVVRRAVIEKVGGFDEALPRGNDGDFIRRVCHDYHADYVPEVLVRCHIDHGFERITAVDRKGMLNAINSHTVKLNKFRADIPRYPEQAANIFSQLGEAYLQLGELRGAAYWYGKAFLKRPFSISMHRRLARGLVKALRGK